MASRQILVLLIAAVLCNNAMGRPSKTKGDCSVTRQKPSVGILRIRYFLFGDDSITQEELELSDLFDQEPMTAGRDKIPSSGTKDQKRPTDQKGRPNPMRPGDQNENQPMARPPVPIPGEPEGQINPANQEKFPVNPTMVDPSKTGVPLPDESVNQLEQQKIQNPNPLAFPAPGQPTQMREPISEDKDRNQEPLEQLNAPKISQQLKSQEPQQQFQQTQQRQPQQQTQQQPFQPQQQPQQPQQQFQPEFQQQPRQEFPAQKQQSQPQQLQQQLQQDQPQQPQQQPQQEFQPQQQPRAMERRKRSFQPIRQFPSDYDDSYLRYGKDFLYPRVEEIYRQAGSFFDDTRPATTNADLRTQDDRSGIYQRPRNDGGLFE